jgi:hypothetical protein
MSHILLFPKIYNLAVCHTIKANHVVIEKRRTARRMAHRSTAGEIDDMAMQYFKVNVFFPFVDHCLMRLGQRFPAKKQACSWHLSVSYASDYYNNDTNRNCENHWLVHCRPTPKCNFSTGNPPMEYVLSKSYRQAILPIWCFHFSRPGLLVFWPSRFTSLRMCNNASRFSLSSTIVVLFHCFRRLKAEKDRLHDTDPIAMVSRVWKISRMFG